MRRAFIIGGTGQIGRTIACELLDQGWQVVLAGRGRRLLPEDLLDRGVTFVEMDREQSAALAGALAGGADAVIDTIAFTEDHADQLLEGEVDIGTFVVISSASVYSDDEGRTLDEAGETGFPVFGGPITEAQATVPPGAKTYSQQKIAMERRMLDRSTRPVSILRPAAVHGPWSAHPREWWFVKRMLDGRSNIPLAYAGQSRLHTSAIENIAALTACVLEAPTTQILNIADPTAPSVAEIGRLIADHLGYEGSFVPFERAAETASAVGMTPWSIPEPLVLDTKAAEAIGYSPVTTYAACVSGRCDWLVSQYGMDWKQRFPLLAAYPMDLFDYAAEDSWLAADQA